MQIVNTPATTTAGRMKNRRLKKPRPRPRVRKTTTLTLSFPRFTTENMNLAVTHPKPTLTKLERATRRLSKMLTIITTLARTDKVRTGRKLLMGPDPHLPNIHCPFKHPTTTVNLVCWFLPIVVLRPWFGPTAPATALR